MKEYNYIALIVFILASQFVIATEYNQLCISGDCKQGQGVFTITSIENGSPVSTLTYQGSFKNSQAQGQGNYTIIDLKNNLDIRYSGVFSQSIVHGNGSLTIRDANQSLYYQGSFANGKPHGNGSLKMQVYNNNSALDECSTINTAASFNQGILQFPKLSKACVETIANLVNLKVCIPYQNPCPVLAVKDFSNNTSNTSSNTTNISNNTTNNTSNNTSNKTSNNTPKYQNSSNIPLANLASAESYNWGSGADQFGLQNTPEVEPLGPHTFAIDDNGQLYVLDSINDNLKQFNQQGKYNSNQAMSAWSEDLIITKKGQIFNLADGKITDIKNNKSYALSEDIPVVQGYRQGLFLDNESLYICKLQQCYQVGVVSKSGFVTILPVDKQAKFIMPAYPVADNLWVRTEWQNFYKIALLFLNDDSEVIKSIVVDEGVALGTVGFLAKDKYNNLYFELEYLLENNKVMYVIWKVSAEGKLLSAAEIPNQYFTTMYKKIIIDNTGKIYQVLTTKEGVDILQWEIN